MTTIETVIGQCGCALAAKGWTPGNELNHHAAETRGRLSFSCACCLALSGFCRPNLVPPAPSPPEGAPCGMGSSFVKVCVVCLYRCCWEPELEWSRSFGLEIVKLNFATGVEG